MRPAAGRLCRCPNPDPAPTIPLDSPRDWVNEHLDRYVATDGEDGYLWNGAPCLLLTYLGAKSGLWRRTVLIFGEHGDALALVASKGGAPSDPEWYRGLVAHPECRVQVRADVFDVGRARPRATSEPPSGRS